MRTHNDAAIEAWLDGLRPDPELTVRQWAERDRIMSGKASAMKGRWRTDTAPFLAEVMESLSLYASYEVVALQTPTQAGKTECCLNLIGYHMAYAPMPILVVEPTLEMVKRFTRQRLDPMIDATPALRRLVSERKSRDAANTVFCKDFPGGILVLATAGSSENLASMPTPIVILDEYEKYDLTKEGDVLGLTKARQVRFPRRKLFACSTPLLADTSQLGQLIDDCAVAKTWQVPCLRCGTYQVLALDHLRYTPPAGLVPDIVPGVSYECEKCNALIDAEREQVPMCMEGRWHAERDQGRLSIGYTLPGLSVAWYPWGRTVAGDLRSRLDPPHARRQTFVNTVLGLPYKEPTEAPTWEPLYARRESYPVNVVPPGVRYLTAYADVQDGWLAVQVIGWGRQNRSWPIAYRILPGDVTDPTKGAWLDLDGVLATDWPCAGGGTLPIWCLGVDSGYNSTTVYKWAKKYARPSMKGGRTLVRVPRTVMVTKGWAQWGPAVRSTVKANVTEKVRGGLKIAHLSTWTLKAELYKWLRRDPPEAGAAEPYGWCHFPDGPGFDETYFHGLVAEAYVQKHGKWTFALPSGVRNEPLDTWTGARACAIACGVEDFTERDWRRLEAALPPGLVGGEPVAPRPAPTRRVAEPESDDRWPTPGPSPSHAGAAPKPGRRFINSFLQGG